MCIFVYMIFLTGGTGLVGSHILMMLVQDNISVKALKRNSSRLDVCRKVFSYHNLDHKFKESNINNLIIYDEFLKDNIVNNIFKFYIPKDVHFNKKGNEILGNKIYEEIFNINK